MLYIVATPIGNLEDITYRAVRVLSEVDLILAEDTRHTAILLGKYEIKNKMMSYREQNREIAGERAVELLREGKNLALVSDAGLPAISDPGSDLVKKCIENDLEFTVVPGATAFSTALVLSGLATDGFSFFGFLPIKSGKRRKFLEKVKDYENTLIFYESPHKLLKTLGDMLVVFGNREIAVARELTKKFEEVKRGKLSEIIEHFEKVAPKGEFVIVVSASN